MITQAQIAQYRAFSNDGYRCNRDNAMEEIVRKLCDEVESMRADAALLQAKLDSFWTEPAALAISSNAWDFRHKHPTVVTLWEEVAELTMAYRGKHEHTPAQELIQVGGIAINLLRIEMKKQEVSPQQDSSVSDPARGAQHGNDKN